MENTALIAVQVLIPILWLWLNVSVRSKRNLEQSTGADAILVLLAFDGAVFVDQDSFSQIVRHPELAMHIGLAHLVFLLFGLIFWNYALNYSARSLKRAYAYVIDDPVSGRKPEAKYWFFGWLFVGLLLIMHLSFYLTPMAQNNG